MLRPATNRTVANIGNQDKLVDWGEVPWTYALDDLSAPDPDGFSPVGFTLSGFPSSKKVRRRNALLGMPGSGMEFPMLQHSNLELFTAEFSVKNRIKSNHFAWPAFSNERTGINAMFAMFAYCGFP